MTTFSIWEFENIKSIDNVVDLLKKYQKTEEKIEDKIWDYDLPERSFNNIGDFQIDTVQNALINDKKIRYVYFEAFAEKSKRKNCWINKTNNLLKPREDLISIHTSNIAIFECESKVYGIFFTAHTTAERNVKIFFSNEWGRIKQKEFELKEDLFYWLFYVVKQKLNCELSENIPIKITGLEGCEGTTKDSVNNVKYEGCRIAVMLGTIAFIFNNESLKKIRPEIEYQGNKLLIELTLVGNFKVWDEKYRIGDLLDADESKQRLNLIFFMILELIPALIECYKENCNSDAWSNIIKLEFLKSLGDEITEKVNIELERLKENQKELIAQT